MQARIHIHGCEGSCTANWIRRFTRLIKNLTSSSARRRRNTLKKRLRQECFLTTRYEQTSSSMRTMTPLRLSRRYPSVGSVAIHNGSLCRKGILLIASVRMFNTAKYQRGRDQGPCDRPREHVDRCCQYDKYPLCAAQVC